jgi:hypothetical protein
MCKLLVLADRKKILLWDFHERAFAGIHLRLIGHNPNMTEVKADKSCEQLKKILQSHLLESLRDV